MHHVNKYQEYSGIVFLLYSLLFFSMFSAPTLSARDAIPSVA